ncbi:hypothetical protein [Streptococcus raffinosi]|uniref:Lipoprotein n=1 Tax=Streptococcus raffinosi TaxID=3053355 RepID=A0ABT7LT83_9STRE|nr:MULTISPECIES: hypothetical protein [unclassified Streptococcus]MDL5043148.1 hypothetical protein [Streptococcus sp. VTCC 12812]MDM0094068.1 hypothetical protein [Streptococcus sp. VTCC 12813]
MKKKINHCLLSFLILILALFLTGFRKMKTSDYNKVRGVIVENCNKVGLHGKVTITKLYWTALEIPTYHVTYTYSEKTYDDQKVVLEQNTAIHEEGSSDSYGNVPEYKESFLKQKSIQKVEKKIEKQLKKQKLGLPISSFSFLSNFSHDEKEKNLYTLASDNLKEGKKDFAGYYQIPYQTLIDKELIEMVIYIDEKTTVKTQDMKEAAKKLDASDLPNGEYSFYQSNFEDGPNNSVDYNFKVKDGKVVFYEDENLVIEDEVQK